MRRRKDSADSLILLLLVYSCGEICRIMEFVRRCSPVEAYGPLDMVISLAGDDRRRCRSDVSISLCERQGLCSGLKYKPAILDGKLEHTSMLFYDTCHVSGANAMPRFFCYG